jgi:glutathione S-transferase
MSMMILRSAAPSPFGRKVQIALALLGLEDVKIEATDTMDAGGSLRRENPLGKIPVLITEDGTAYYDSRVILEFSTIASAEARSFRATPAGASLLCACKRYATESSTPPF